MLISLAPCLSIVSTTRRAKSSAPSPPFKNTLFSAKPTPNFLQWSARSAISSSVSSPYRFSVTITGWPKRCIFSTWRSRFAKPSTSAWRSCSCDAPSTRPPCIFKPRKVETRTVTRGWISALRHLISKNFSAPRSAPNPASVIA